MPPRNVASAPESGPASEPVPTPEPKAAAGKKVVVATEWPTAKFKVGDIVITSAGTALDLDQADKVRTAAKSAGVKLKEGEVK